MKRDPKMVKKGKRFVCAQCGEPLNDLTVKNQDPFCRTACANGWHEFVPLSAQFTLSGHEAGYTGARVPRWNGEANDRRRTEAA